MNKPLLPNFIGIGAQRAGSTWLNQCLREHPEIYLPIKEIRFFNYNYSKGLEHYCENFIGLEEQKIWGEITPDYYRDKDALERIAKDLKNVKILFVLRNPIERSLSQYQLYKAHGDYTEATFEEAVSAHPELIEWSLQGRTLQWLSEMFEQKNLLFVLYDDINKAPKVVLQRILDFLEVNPDFVPSVLNKRVNRVVFPRTQKALKGLGLEKVIDLVKKSPFAHAIKEWGFKSNKNKVSINIRKELLSAFKDDIASIEKVLNRDLSHWRS
ncbi:MAG: sulfotransferase domain-containing protein [Colwellia sp.]|nr:sulfotransferase domain-containing protein [Colwellia sp.]